MLPQGYFLQPTVFMVVDQDAEVHKEEIFSPVAVIRSFETEDEIIKMSNDSEFGLMAGVITQDINKALRVSAAFDAGTVGVNCMFEWNYRLLGVLILPKLVLLVCGRGSATEAAAKGWWSV